MLHPTITYRQASPGRLSAFEDVLFKGTAGTTTGAGEGGGVSAAAAAAAEVPLLAAVWLGAVDGSRVVGVAFLDTATRQVSSSFDCCMTVLCRLVT